MKTLLMTNEYPPHVYGGAGVHVDYLSRAMAQIIDVEVRCFGEQSLTKNQLHVQGYGYDAPAFAASDALLRSPLQAMARNVRFTAAPIDADVVHCHTWYTYFAGILAKLVYGKPLFITTHSLEPLRPWKREQLGRGYDLSCWIERTALQMADAVIAVSNEMQRDIARLFGIDPARLHVIYNGIDTEEYRAVTDTDVLIHRDIDPKVPYVLFVGRITRQKGIAHLLHAIPHLRPNTQVVICAGAPDTEAIGREIATLVQQLQQQRPGIVWIREMVDKRTLIQLYSHAAVFCCPSVYEPFGIINLEAMACSTPVVASAVGGIPEVVVNGETGILVPFEPHRTEPEPADPEGFALDLAAALNQLLEDNGLRQRMGSAGRVRAVENFGWPAIARRVVQLYETVLAR